ncbi:SDR family oxidoreductase [Pseudobacillus wudalianchiensis]|uniref:Sugar epimerase n=1 Tax=Pseudobacillus wudalianchiensis TaxID=1743143 RepID=A0A1B9AAJ2_9BACI|nr:SDR family oxidoreductase [Bacillus wudalianchiensis]OCA80862.1 sugar epimerase [Bacillus wudalianchiensis]
MKVLVVGANGQIGRQVVELLQESEEHTARALVRRQEQAESFETSRVEAAVADLEGSVEEITEAAKGCEAVIFTAGSGGQTGWDKTLLIDLDGAVKTIEAAQKAGISRFIMVSALQAHRREHWNEAIKPYYVAKHYADKVLQSSGLTYTVIRPGGLLNEKGTGKVAAAESLERSSIPREDVAKTVVASLSEGHTFNRSFDLVSGEDPISEALKRI